MSTTIRTCDQLIKEFPYLKAKQTNTRLPMLFNDNDNRDIYNISAPFFHKGKQILLGRVEPRDTEDSDTAFFVNDKGIWKLDTQYTPLKHLQDPFYCYIDGTLIIGGVEIDKDVKDGHIVTYRTVFYRESAPHKFEKFAQGPEKMKDIRLLELPNKKILVATRPQGIDGSRGRIGFKIIDSLNELNSQTILSARILDKQFIKEEWGGVNGLYILENGKVGVLSHIAKYDQENNVHYYSSCFVYDVNSGNYSPMKIIATRNNFENGQSKRKSLEDVVFSGGIVRSGNGTAKLYCGVGDAEAHCISILDPFLYFDRSFVP